MGMILVLTVFLRISMLEIPLERDEGEYAYMGQLLLQGIPPYLHIYSMKLPGLCVIYSVIMGIFGQSIFAIHLGLLIFNGFAIVLVFLLTRYLADEFAGVIAALVYALLSVSPSVKGTFAHATQFIVPIVLGGLLLLLKAIDQKKIWMLVASGFLLGSAFILKQHAIFFVLFAICYCFWRLLNMPMKKIEVFSKILILIISSLLPFLITCGLLYLSGVFSTFWFWAFTYASKYASVKPISFALMQFTKWILRVIYPWKFIWLIAAIGLFTIILNEKNRSNVVFGVGFLVFSFLTICPGFYFRPHYSVTLLPAIAMLSGIAISASITYLPKRLPPYLKTLPVFLIILALGLPAWQQKNFFCANFVETSRMLYSASNPFYESLVVSKYIKNHSSETDTIAVLGSEPQIYFYSNRKSATGYIYMYGLMEHHVYASQMQKNLIREIESSKPRYIVFVNTELSWSENYVSDPYIFEWTYKHIKDHYLLKHVIKSMSYLRIKTVIKSRDTRQGRDPLFLVFERK